MLVVGGFGSAEDWANDVPLASAEIYDPVGGSWTFAPASPRAQFGLALRDDGSVVLAGGAAEGAALPSSELYWPSTLTSEAMEMPGGATRCFHTLTRLADGRALVAGGSASPKSFSPPPLTPSSILLDNAPFEPEADAGTDAGAAGAGGAAGSSGNLECGSGTVREGNRCVGEDAGCGCRLGNSGPARCPFWLALAALAIAGKRVRETRRKVQMTRAEESVISRVVSLAVLACAAWMVTGCDKGSADGFPRAPRDAIPDSIHVQPGLVEVGAWGSTPDVVGE